MVLKRKRDGEFVAWNSSTQWQQPPVPQYAVPAPVHVHVQVPDPSPPKRTRTSKSNVNTDTESASAPKKSRVPCGKKAATAAVAVSAPLPTPTTLYNPPDPYTYTSTYTTYASSSAGPSSSQPSASTYPTSSQPARAPAKRGRKKKAPAGDLNEDGTEQEHEKRGAKFKPKCPQNILDRVARVRSQRIFMIDRQRTPGELREEFSVLGSTGNVYTVTIDRVPHCNCPDHLKGNHCKHILFVFLKVLQVTQASGFWYQKALLKFELTQIFNEAPLAPNSVAHAHIREAHARATGRAPAACASTSTRQGQGNKRLPGPDDDCPICYDGMHGTAEGSLVFCVGCGNALHKECFGEWRKTSAKSGKDLTCVWCRAKWVDAVATAGAGAAGGGAGRASGGYLNLAGAVGVSPVRDTSSYYHGPTRGQRYYGYREYND